MRRLLVGFIFAVFTFILWLFLIALRWDYVVNVMYPGEALGEPIWVHDPSGFWMISIASGLVGIVFVFLILTVRIGNHTTLDGK